MVALLLLLDVLLLLRVVKMVAQGVIRLQALCQGSRMWIHLAQASLTVLELRLRVLVVLVVRVRVEQLMMAI